MACLPAFLNAIASGANESLMLFVTHSRCVPEPSVSRYLCTSKMRFVLLPSRFVIAERAAREPEETKAPAPLQPLPGRRIICEVAPAVRIAFTQSWTVVAQVVMLGTVGGVS